MEIEKTINSVIINRAVPGSGKSTISKCIIEKVLSVGLKATIHSTDEYFKTNENVYDFKPEKLEENHKKNLDAFIKDLQNGINIVICDNTNLSPWQSKPYTEVARKYNYQIVFIDYPPREYYKHIESQIVTYEKPDAHQVPVADILDKIEEYYKHRNLLDKNNPIKKKNTKDIWDNSIQNVRKSNLLEEHYDLDVLITINPDEYHDAKKNIGNIMLGFIKKYKKSKINGV